MRRLFIVAMLLCSTTMHAQWDTVRRPRLFPEHAPLFGAMFFSAGSLVSMRPELHDYERDLYRHLDVASAHKMHFDDYLQFAPVVAPFLLSACGVRSEHNMGQLFLLTSCSYLIGLAAIETGKILYRTERPDGSAATSFPSGHTFSAFVGAEILRREFGREYPWIAYVGYGVAMLVGFMRMYNNRHWPSDVLGGVGLGILSVSASYRLFNQR